MKQIFLIGPSGVGKTSLSRRLSEIERTLVHVSFDEQVKIMIDSNFTVPQHRSGEEGREFWNFCKGVVDSLSRSSGSDIILLFDVDAGAEYIPECQAYLTERSKSLICLIAAPDVIYKREEMRAAGLDIPPRSKEEFLAKEFSPTMREFYNTATIIIDVSNDDVETSVERLRVAVDTLKAQ
jgi:shikimate kinase